MREREREREKERARERDCVYVCVCVWMRGWMAAACVMTHTHALSMTHTL